MECFKNFVQIDYTFKLRLIPKKYLNLPTHFSLNRFIITFSIESELLGKGKRFGFEKNLFSR